MNLAINPGIKDKKREKKKAPPTLIKQFAGKRKGNVKLLFYGKTDISEGFFFVMKIGGKFFIIKKYLNFKFYFYIISMSEKKQKNKFNI